MSYTFDSRLGRHLYQLLPQVYRTRDRYAQQGQTDSGSEDLARYPNAGFLLSTSDRREVHEWVGYRGGVFSYQVLGAMHGAADVDEDGVVSYAEAHAYVVAANMAVTPATPKVTRMAWTGQFIVVITGRRSAKKVAMETPGCDELQLVSFHSTSKGTIGECGRRGGYMELHNIDSYVQSQLYKLASSGLCSNIPGQLMTSLMVKPPKEGDESYEQFVEEEGSIFEGMKRRAKALVDGLNKVDGIKCNPAEGAMYAFPSVQIPPKAIEYAEQVGMAPDNMYALSLLEETGICVVPASGFGQKAGRAGFRTTFLPPDEKMMAAIDKFATHHQHFCAKFA